MLQLIDFTADGKSDWAPWPGGVAQLAATGGFGGGTLSIELTYDDVSGQTDPTNKVTVDSLTAAGVSDGKLLIAGGQTRVFLTGATSPAIKGVGGRAAHSALDRHRTATPA